MPPFDDLFLRINSWAADTAWLHAPASAYAKYGILVFGVLTIVGWWFARRQDGRAVATALLVPVGALVAFAIQQGLVALVGEARPYAVHPQALVLVARTTDGSFPSDHACLAGAFAAGLFLVDRRLGWIATAAAVLMAADRVYVGAHWPLDVVAGLIVGAGIALVVIVLLRPIATRLVEWLRGTRLQPLVAT